MDEFNNENNNLENEEKIESHTEFQLQTENNGSSLKPENQKKIKIKDLSWLKTLLIGVIGGLIGTEILIVLVLCIPSVKKAIIGENKSTGSGTSTIEFGDYDNPVVAIAEKVGPAVVGITVEYEYASFFGTQKATQEGSGVIISSDGYILTNNHVVNAETTMGNSEAKINVYLPNSKEPIGATIQGTDKETDIAIIKIDCTDLPYAELGDSEDLKVGELVVAIGNPLGMEFAGSVSVGYISALDRQLTDTTGNSFKLIQTDAAINSGNSGGALVNSKGQVIGINTAKIQGTGIEGLGFAIPVDDIKPIKDDLIKIGRVQRPHIGIYGRNVDEETAKKRNLAVGVYVQTIETFSAAERAGIKVGDVIIEMAGEKVTTMEELNEIKNNYKVGDKIKVVVNREGKQETFELTLQEQ